MKLTRPLDFIVVADHSDGMGFYQMFESGDPKEQAFYYVRVLEIPTPRWTAYDAERFGTKPGKEVTMQLQERAYTSPIWYTPN